MALTAGTVLGNLTPQIGQPISQTLIDILKLATNAANAIYNLDLSTSAYLQGRHR
ncbi:hypothetical protein ACFDAU_15250 [Sulfuriferula sp. GW1]|uniref:hypothetical protein n=1 Tax=Sulfuriferula sp. GW1 TaxID=3345111 RepID=UPI0039AF046B